MILSNGTPTTVSSLSDTTPGYGWGSYGSSSALVLAGSAAAYGEIYRKQLWVGVVVRKLAMATARNPFDVKRALNGNEQQPEAGPLADLLARPNDRLSGFHLWLWTSATFDTYGEAFWWKVRDGAGIIRELMPLHPTNITIRRLDDGSLEYVYANKFAIPEADIVAFVNYNPDNARRGVSNLEALRMTLLNEDASRRATASWWQKGARPSVILQHKTNLSPPAIERLKIQFDNENAGADNMGKTLVVEEGMEAKVIQLNAEEMQYIESRKLNREEVCAAYDVPPPVVHILDKATFSNITEQLRSMYRDTMAPRFELFESVVDHQLVPDFYPQHDVFTKFNMDEVLRGDFETRATAVGTLIQTGVLKPSEARPMFGLAPAGAEADQLFGNAALVPLGSNARSAQVSEDGELIPTPLKSLPPLVLPPAKTIGRREAVTRRVGGALARVKASPAAAREKLLAHHTKELQGFFAEQRDSVLAAAGTKDAGLFDPADWNDALADILTALSTAAADTVGKATAKKLGSDFDGTAVTGWVEDTSKKSAKRINEKTKEQLDVATADLGEDDDLGDVVTATFDGPVASRASEISLTRLAVVAGFAALVAGQQSGAATKTWNVNSTNPRASHASMNGETVGIEENFSNGMGAPGDPEGGADEVAGCTCDLTFNFD